MACNFFKASSCQASFSSYSDVIRNIEIFEKIQSENHLFLSNREIIVKKLYPEKERLPRFEEIIQTMNDERDFFAEKSFFSVFKTEHTCRQILHTKYKYQLGLNGTEIRMIPPPYSIDSTPVPLLYLAAKVASLKSFSLQNSYEYQEILIHCLLQKERHSSEIILGLLEMARLIECCSLQLKNCFVNRLELFCQSAKKNKEEYLPSTRNMISAFSKLQLQNKLFTSSCKSEMALAENMYKYNEEIIFLFSEAEAQFNQVFPVFSSIYRLCYFGVDGTYWPDTPRPPNFLDRQVNIPKIHPDKFPLEKHSCSVVEINSIFDLINSKFNQLTVFPHIGKSTSAIEGLNPLPTSLAKEKRQSSFDQLANKKTEVTSIITVLMPSRQVIPPQFYFNDGPDLSLRFSLNCAKLYRAELIDSLPQTDIKIRFIALSLISVLMEIGDVTELVDGNKNTVEKIYSLFGEIITRDGSPSKKGSFVCSYNPPLASVTDAYFTPVQSFYDVLNAQIRYGSSYLPNQCPMPSSEILGRSVLLPDDGSRITRIEVNSGCVEVRDPKNKVIFSVFSTKLR